MRTPRNAYERWLAPDMLERITNWAAKGCTMEELAHDMGVSPSTLYKWRGRYEEIARAIDAGRMLGVEAVENSLFRQAVGEVYEEATVTEKDIVDGKERVHVRKVRTKKAPSVSAQIFYLKNRAGYRDNPPEAPQADAGVPEDPLSAALDEVARGLDGGRHGA